MYSRSLGGTLSTKIQRLWKGVKDDLDESKSNEGLTSTPKFVHIPSSQKQLSLIKLNLKHKMSSNDHSVDDNLEEPRSRSSSIHKIQANVSIYQVQS